MNLLTRAFLVCGGLTIALAGLAWLMVLLKDGVSFNDGLTMSVLLLPMAGFVTLLGVVTTLSSLRLFRRRIEENPS